MAGVANKKSFAVCADKARSSGERMIYRAEIMEDYVSKLRDCAEETRSRSGTAKASVVAEITALADEIDGFIAGMFASGKEMKTASFEMIAYSSEEARVSPEEMSVKLIAFTILNSGLAMKSKSSNEKMDSYGEKVKALVPMFRMMAYTGSSE